MSKAKRYKHREIEAKWQKKWLGEKIYSPDIKRAKNPFYNLMMFPYPSAEGMHVGNMYAFTGSDIYGRLKRMQGYSVFEPIGLDGFGIHSENYAIKIGEHPSKVSKRTEKHFYKQLQATGNAYDWSTRLETYDPKYFRWTQWIFVEMFRTGLAYRKKASVNWCPSCKTVLADEQVVAGVCERCKSKVTQKQLAQWFFRITDYAERLLKNLDWIDWSDKIKIAQRNWIGKSTGTTVYFPIVGAGRKKSIESFTTRPDTLYGTTFFVLAPEHPQLYDVTSSKYKEKVQKYVSAAKDKKIEERTAADRTKTGVFTGGYVINPVTNKKIPVYLADYVVMEYGTGAIMGVPAHDQRDWEFAKARKLPVLEVISGGNIKKEAYDGPGEIVNSGSWDGLKVPENIGEIVSGVAKKKWGKRTISYHLRDWLISRQRYWGPPIPMIYCKLCKSKNKSWLTQRHTLGKRALLHEDQSDWDHSGWYPVDDKDLPVELPYVKNYQPRGTGESPLAQIKEWVKVKCPGCGSDARRETDVSDTFLDSAWYFFRYPSIGAKSSKLKIDGRRLEIPWNREINKRWLPVDMYIGGAEHAVLHLLYTRFITMAFKDMGFTDFEEPFKRFYAHGLLIKDGAKMSKSRGNVVVPDEYIEKFGADVLRAYLMFLGPYNQGGDFRDAGIEGMRRFIKRVWDIYTNYSDVILVQEKDSREVLVKMHQTIKKVTEDIQNLKYNTAISTLMEFVNLIREKASGADLAFSRKNSTFGHPASPKSASLSGSRQSAGYRVRCAEWDEALRTLALLLAPIAPHLAEELWVSVLGEKFSIHTSAWPKFKPELVKEETVTIIVQVGGKLRATLKLKTQDSKVKREVVKLAKADTTIKKWLRGKKIREMIFIPGKLINFVI